MTEKTDLIDILQKQKLISAEQASQVKLEQINTGRDLTELIKQRNWVTAKQITAAQAELLKVPFVDLTDKAISTDALGKIPESVARHYTLIPLEIKGDTLQVAMKDPLDLQVLEFLETKTNQKIKVFMAEEEAIKKAIKGNYEVGMEREVQAALRETEKEAEKVEEEVKKMETMEEIVKFAPITRIVSTILDYAAKSRASDVHIEPQEGETRVRYRIDGVLGEKLSLPRAVHDAVVSRIKILANLKIDEKRVPQDGRFMIESNGAQIDLRVSTLPASHGEKVVMRLLRKSGQVPSLSELGLRGTALKHIEQALKKTHGIILVTGPTGSGKTTTLRTALSKVNSVEINIITLEDPVEYEIPGVNQVQVNPAAGLTFASGLRSILRQDPDVIMVGEIRDQETMELAVQAALTGHLVFSTLHTNSAAGTLPRLLDMGAESFLLASTMEVVLAQRLVRTLCECKKEVSPDEKVVQRFKEVLGPLYPKQKQLKVYQAVGCEKCGNAGFTGRMGIYEALPISEKIGRLILERETSDRIEAQAIDEGMLTILQDGFMKVIEGVTTVEEVLRVAQE